MIRERTVDEIVNSWTKDITPEDIEENYQRALNGEALTISISRLGEKFKNKVTNKLIRISKKNLPLFCKCGKPRKKHIHTCEDCRKDKRRKYRRKYYRAHSKEINKAQREYRKKHYKKFRKMEKGYYIKHRKEILKRAKARYQLNALSTREIAEHHFS